MGKDLKGNELGKGLSQRKDGLYQARVYGSGYSKAVYFYGHDIRELKEKREELLKAKKEKVHIDKMRITFGRWFEQWMSLYKVGHIKDTTLRNYWSAYNRCRKHLERKRLCDLEPIHFQRLINYLYDEGYATSSVKPTISVIQQCLQRAVYDKMLPYNPCDGVILDQRRDFTPVKHSDEDEKCLTADELENFFEVAQNARYRDVFLIMLHTGMRSGELCALEWDDIDFENKSIHVYKTLNRISRYYDQDGNKLKEPLHVIQITSPKREASNRYIPMTDIVADIFRDWKQIQDADKQACKKRWGEKNFLLNNYPNLAFTTSTGNPLTPGTISIECKRLTSILNSRESRVAEKEHREYKEVKIHPHLFRHTFTTQCYESGMDPMLISMIVGHSKQKMTKHYTHPSAQFVNTEFNKYARGMHIYATGL